MISIKSLTKDTWKDLCKFPDNKAEFSGRFSTYSKFGFKSAGEASEFYQRMELK